MINTNTISSRSLALTMSSADHEILNKSSACFEKAKGHSYTALYQPFSKLIKTICIDVFMKDDHYFVSEEQRPIV